MEQPSLFELPPPQPPPKKFLQPELPVWTEHKAGLIERYIFFFVMVTKHGAYLDGFAGPQEPTKPDTWSAKRVLEFEPRWIRHVHLFEQSSRQVERLRALVATQSPVDDRTVSIWAGDFNQRVHELLASGLVGEKEATFCLLDQRTFECHWSTLEALAQYKASGYKIELFYFLANSWLDRALAGVKRDALVEQWWGRHDWRRLRGVPGIDRARLFAERFRRELGYRWVVAWPIYERRRRAGHIMYFMLHATDHPAAPRLMRRAYDEVMEHAGGAEQLPLLPAELP